MNTKRFVLLIILFLLTSALVSVRRLNAWRWNGTTFIQQPIRNVTSAVSPIELKVAKKNHDCPEFYENSLTITRREKFLERYQWQSPEDWRVQEVLYSDLNRDGVQEFLLLVWRPFQSWPIDKFLPLGGRISNHQDKNGMSCHVILIGWDGQEYRELWAGSALAAPISNVTIADIDGDQYMELLAIENDYDEFSGGNLVVWKWQGFGFSLLDRIEGRFNEFSVIEAGTDLVIFTD